MNITYNRIECQEKGCDWRTRPFAPIMVDSCQEVTVIHVILEHPKKYTQATGKKPPEIDDNGRLLLNFWTETERLG